MPKSVLLLVVYIVIIFIAFKKLDEKEYGHKVKDHDEDAKEVKEVADNFIPDKELEFVFVRSSGIIVNSYLDE